MGEDHTLTHRHTASCVLCVRAKIGCPCPVPQCLAIGRGLRSRHTARSAPPGSDVDSLHSTVGQPAGLVVSARTRLPPKAPEIASERPPIAQNDNAAKPAAGQARAEPPRHTGREALGEGEFLRRGACNPPARGGEGGAVRAANANAARIRTTRSGTANCRAISAELMFRNIRPRWIVASAAPDHHEIGGSRRNSEAVHRLPPDKRRRPRLWPWFWANCRPNLTG